MPLDADDATKQGGDIMAASDGSVKIDILGDAKGFENTIKGIADTAKNVLKGIAVAKVTQEFVALGKSALDAYASYEQLVGGVETLFGTSADTVKQYADNAYKTAGLSANQYMETATSFAASLLQGLGGDTEEAAKMADLAITDMSDNANKMGTSMSSIQYAYQGFAKQNYTMLDNLKLGYGGTQAEMARLINDSGVLGDTMEVTAKTVNNVSFDKIIEAIHVVQTRMGITGTTAQEAAETIEGSVNSAKAAWENLVTGLGDENANLEQLVTNLIESVETAAGNIIPRIGQIISGIGSAIMIAAPQVAEAGGQMMQSLVQSVTEGAPAFFETAGKVISQFVEAISSNLGSIVSAGLQIVGKLLEGVIQALPNVIDSASNIINSLKSGLSEAIPQILETGAEVVSSLVDCIIENAPMIWEAATALIDELGNSLSEKIPALSFVFENLETVVAGVTAAFVAFKAATAISAVVSAASSAINGFSVASAAATIKTVALTAAQTALNAAMNANPFVLIVTLIAGVTAALVTLYNTNEDFRNSVNSVWNAVVETISGAVESIVVFFTETVPDAINSLIEWVKKIPQKIKEELKKAVDTVKENINNAVETVTSKFEDLREKIKGIWDNIVETISGAVENIKLFFTETVPEAIENMLGWFQNLPNELMQVGRNMIDGLIQGFTSKVSDAVNAVKNVGRQMVNGVKSVLKIHSPSKVFDDEVGAEIPPGIGNGVKKEMPKLTSDMEKDLQGLVKEANEAVSAEVSGFTGKVSLAADARRSANTEPQTITNDNGIVVNLNYYGMGEPTEIKRISRQIGIEAAKEMRSRGVLA